MAKSTGHGGRREGAGRPKRSTRDDVAIKYDRQLAQKARQVALDRGLSLAEYLTEMTRAAVGRDYAALLRKIDKGEGK